MKKRLAAEWEPAVGVLIAWPICIPSALVTKLAHDTQLHLMCADEAGIQNAKETLPKMGIDPEAVRYLVVPKGDDEFWVRDWGPHPLFDEMGNYALLGPRYTLATPHCGTEENATLYCTPWGNEKVPLTQFDGNTADDLAAEPIAHQLGLSFIKAPFAFTGGNVLNDGINTVISTKVLVAENEFEGLTREAFFDYATKITGMTNYIVLPNYEEFSLNHIDCFLKILDERRLLVMRAPKDSDRYPIYENLVARLQQTTNSYGEPWQIIRMDTGITRDGNGFADYVNSLILNDCVYVPMYGIPADEGALATWRAAMPGYDVQGFTFEFADEPFSVNPDDLYNECGWVAGDVLHCRTRAVWDSQMLHVDVPGPVGTPTAGTPVVVQVRAVAYSATQLVAEKTCIRWRTVDETDWQTAPLVPSPINEVLCAEIPAQPSGTAIEYYAHVADESGRETSSPRVAPAQYLTYVVR